MTEEEASDGGQQGGVTPKRWVARNQHKLDKQLRDAVQYGDYEKAEKALQKGANPNQRFEQDGTEWSLVIRALMDLPDLTRLLLDQGADLSVADSGGCTALHVAFDASQVDMLIDAGMDPNVRSKTGETPLHCLLDVGVAQALIRRGADPKALCDEGRLPWQGVEQSIEAMKLMGPLTAKREALVDVAVKWLRGQAEGVELDEVSPPVQMTDAESTRRAQARRP